MQLDDESPLARILIVDDQALTRELMNLVIRAQGHKTLVATSGEEALALASERPLDLVILDVVMPGMDGFEVARRLRADARTRTVPIVIVSALNDQESRIKGLAAGADDFLTRPVDRLELKVRVQNLLRMKRAQDELAGQNAILERKVELRTVELERSNRETIHTLIRAAAHRDDESGAHVKRMGHYTALLAQRLRLDTQFCTTIALASQLHDIGKIGIADRILDKPDVLSKDEWEVMKTHTDIGGRMLALNSSPYLAMAADIARAHHEHWDGSGYPLGLRGAAIPLAARITKLCDTYDSLRSRRPYKPAMDHAAAASSILVGDSKSRPAYFDPETLAAFKTGVADFRDIFETIRD
ncbi:MAG: response regulator [Betaproteobacteria bacterium]|nr:response regulator [Betaproteobacteria bacterium]